MTQGLEEAFKGLRESFKGLQEVFKGLRESAKGLRESINGLDALFEIAISRFARLRISTQKDRNRMRTS